MPADSLGGMPVDHKNIQISLQMGYGWRIKSDVVLIDRDTLLVASGIEAHKMLSEALKQAEDDLHRKREQEGKPISPTGIWLTMDDWPVHERQHFTFPLNYQKAINRILVATSWAKLDGLAVVYFERIKGKTAQYAERILAEALIEAVEARITPSYLERVIRKRQALL